MEKMSWNTPMYKKLAIILLVALFVSSLLCGCSSTAKNEGANGQGNENAAAKGSTFVSDYNPGEENVFGNTSGNLSNGGDMAFQGDWIYYVDNNSIKKMKTDGTQKATIANTTAGSLQAVGDWIYYSQGNTFNKMKTDGSENTTLLYYSSDKSYIGRPLIAGNYMYYCEDVKSSNTETTTNIVRTKTDLSEKAVLYVSPKPTYKYRLLGINGNTLYLTLRFGDINKVSYSSTPSYNLWKFDLSSEAGTIGLIGEATMYNYSIIGDRLFYVAKSGASHFTHYIDINGTGSLKNAAVEMPIDKQRLTRYSIESV